MPLQGSERDLAHWGKYHGRYFAPHQHSFTDKLMLQEGGL